MARGYEAEREAAAAAAARRARAANVEVAQRTKPVAHVVTVAKLEDKLASDPTTITEIAKSSTTDTPDGKRVCRRYSAAIAALVDVPCE
jgi:hypothetical protein